MTQDLQLGTRCPSHSQPPTSPSRRPPPRGNRLLRPGGAGWGSGVGGGGAGGAGQLQEDQRISVEETASLINTHHCSRSLIGTSSCQGRRAFSGALFAARCYQWRRAAPCRAGQGRAATPRALPGGSVSSPPQPAGPPRPQACFSHTDQQCPLSTAGEGRHGRQTVGTQPAGRELGRQCRKCTNVCSHSGCTFRGQRGARA